MARVAMLVGEMFEDVEFRVPYEELRQAGHEVTVVGQKRGEKLEGKQGRERIETQAGVQDVEPESFDALVIPGGYGPDHLRMNHQVVDWGRGFAQTHRPLAAVCHAPSLLIDADLVRGRRLTSWPSVRVDLLNAGAEWVDEKTVVDDNLITARKPDDLEDFSQAILSRLR